MRRLKPAMGLWKIQPQRVVTPGKQTNSTSGSAVSRDVALSEAKTALLSVVLKQG